MDQVVDQPLAKNVQNHTHVVHPCHLGKPIESSLIIELFAVEHIKRQRIVVPSGQRILGALFNRVGKQKRASICQNLVLENQHKLKKSLLKFGQLCRDLT